MLKMTGFDVLFQAAGWLYILATLAAMAFAVWVASRWWTKLIAAVSVFLIFAAYPYAVVRKEQETQRAQQERYARAKALFGERCKSAGETVLQTVSGVAGVLLMKARPKEINLDDQYRMDDPFGADCHGEECIADLLQITEGKDLNASLSSRLSSRLSFVDFVDPIDNKRYRYTGSIVPEAKHRLTLKRTPTDAEIPIVGISWEDISSREDRDYWIAGGSLKVVNTKTGQILGERRGFMIDRAQGNRDGGRSPWAFAYDNACPKFPTVSDGRAV
jgi:hypothetical protein